MTEWKPLELFFKVTGVQGISYSVSLTFLPERKKQRNPPGLSRVSEEGFDPVFPRHFHDNSAYPVLLLSLSRVTFSFPIPQPLPSPASRVAIKSRIPSTNFVFFRIIAALYFVIPRTAGFREYTLPFQTLLEGKWIYSCKGEIELR